MILERPPTVPSDRTRARETLLWILDWIYEVCNFKALISYPLHPTHAVFRWQKNTPTVSPQQLVSVIFLEKKLQGRAPKKPKSCISIEKVTIAKSIGLIGLQQQGSALPVQVPSAEISGRHHGFGAGHHGQVIRGQLRQAAALLAGHEFSTILALVANVLPYSFHDGPGKSSEPRGMIGGEKAIHESIVVGGRRRVAGKGGVGGDG